MNIARRLRRKMLQRALSRLLSSVGDHVIFWRHRGNLRVLLTVLRESRFPDVSPLSRYPAC